eukprot:1503412-Heterocapsa_arctica.AAC.1
MDHAEKKGLGEPRLRIDDGRGLGQRCRQCITGVAGLDGEQVLRQVQPEVSDQAVLRAGKNILNQDIRPEAQHLQEDYGIY